MNSVSVQDRPENRRTRLLMWLGHYSDVMIWGFIAAVILGDATGNSIGWIEDTGAVVCGFWVLTKLADSRVHMERLCERCAAATPLDCQAAVRRWKRALWWRHQRKAQLAVFIVMAAIFLLDAIAGKHVWVYAVHAFGFLVLGLTTIPAWQHRRLQPWCPYCRWDDGGDEEVAPDVPAPAVSR